MSAGEALTRGLLGMAENGRRPRCGDWAEGNPWLSDDPGLRGMAARWCVGCPVLAECDRAGVEAKHTFGVWGGHDRTARGRRPSSGRGTRND